MARPLAAERGFTMIELLVTLLLLTTGFVGVLSMVDGVNARTLTTREREAATALTREIAEQSRSVPYSEITTNGVKNALQGIPGLEDTTPATQAWTVERRNQTYTIALGVCTVDDPEDRVGDHSAGTYCGDAAAPSSPPDRNPDDYKRVAMDVTWTRRGTTREVKETTTVPNETNTTGPRITKFDPDPDTDFITTDVNTVEFDPVQTDTPAASITYAVDGVITDTDEPTGTTSSFDWRIDHGGTHVPDGTYVLTATAFDADGRAGIPRSRTIRLNRDEPVAPTGLVGGWNPLQSAVELDWNRNPEPDVVGYRVYRSVGGAAATLVTDCDLASTPNVTTCADTTQPPAGVDVDYYVVGLDEDPFSGSPREGTRSSILRVKRTANRPVTPPTASASSTADGRAISWAASPAATPVYTGSAVGFYRIYRGGTAISDRIGTAGTGELTFTDPNGQTGNSYWVTAVDSFYAESVPVGPVVAP